jgi:hypothetical protein
MSIPPPWPQVLDFFGTPFIVEPSEGRLSGDAGFATCANACVIPSQLPRHTPPADSSDSPLLKDFWRL